jgi:hypothetical protein
MMMTAVAQAIQLLLTIGIEASLVLTPWKLRQHLDKFNFCLIAQGVKVSKTVLDSVIGKVALHVNHTAMFLSAMVIITVVQAI